MAQRPQNSFYLVPAGGIGRSLTSNQSVSSKRLDIWEAYNNLATRAQNEGGCQAIFHWWCPRPTRQQPNAGEWRYTSVRNESRWNEGRGFHAEEVFLEKVLSENNLQDVYINAALITLEPCHSKRYSGKDCRSYFQTGRPIKKGMPVQKLVPGLPITPIFFLESQVPEGARAEETKKAANAGLNYERIRAKMGPLLGEPYSAPRPGAAPTWRISGQESCEYQQDHIDKLAKWLNTARPAVSFPKWDHSDITDKRIVEAVKPKIAQR